MGDIATRVRRIFGDEASVQITDQDIIRWINDCQERIILENEGLMETTAKADTVQGVREYPVPADMSVLRSLSYKGFRLKYMSFAEFNEYIDGFAAQPGISPYGPGIPEIFMIWNNTINLFPVPSETLAQSLYIYYMKHPVAVDSLADTPDVPVQYHIAIVDYVLKMAYELDEDMYKASIKEGEFKQRIQMLNDRNKWISQEYYPRITTLPEDENYGMYGYWGGYY